ncbi:N-6 DNA methylase [Acidithiobacillus sp. MC6.1]|nr:N-6 DNA methylase [Acidithiobacillus sp. MC6.1]
MKPVRNLRSERRAEWLLADLLQSQGWDLRAPPHGHALIQNEYRNFPDIAEHLETASKTGGGRGIPELLLLKVEQSTPLAVVETKRYASDIMAATKEAQQYANHFDRSGQPPLAVGLAGTEESGFAITVTKKHQNQWVPVTYDGEAITWIPNPQDMERLFLTTNHPEIRPTIPPMAVLASRADEINRLLRESHIKDELRPASIAAIMLALWHSRGNIRRTRDVILKDINQSCQEAFRRAAQPDLAASLRVDEANEKLSSHAKRICTILERLNITVLTAEHDYLGQLYEAFFRYTGGNTIGQYFTPRHITRMMADVCVVGPDDTVIDPSCGTGGFLIACMERLTREYGLPREEMVRVIQRHLVGYEEEPVTAALCVANMILRGDGSTRIHKGDCFSVPDYPLGMADIALTNPPFPHRNTDTPPEAFVERSLDALRHRGRLAVILPTSVLVKQEKASWRQKMLENNTLVAVCQLPDELFQPFASATTSFVVIEKGVPNGSHQHTVFIRMENDGWQLRKGVRVEKDGPNDIADVIHCIANKSVIPGFSGTANVQDGMEWASGAYVANAHLDEKQLVGQVDILLRRLASFYTRYAPEILRQRELIENGEIHMVRYQDILSKLKLLNASLITGTADQVGGNFSIYYGLSEIESRYGMPDGGTLIVSPTEQYNGCYGWLDFGTVLQPPFITVARTGSIGEAFVHVEPCAPNSDCLVLLPKNEKSADMPYLLMTAAAIREEKWRYNYGRKITPKRIASVEITPHGMALKSIEDAWMKFSLVIAGSFHPYRP